MIAGVRENWGRLRMLSFPFGGQFADFFRGNKLGGWHFGGTLPMSDSPEIGQCKPSGEVFGLDGTFIIDSAAFPEIPGSTVALLISAHAHRVASSWINKQKDENKYAS
jgi:choline dehydrogenase-like flavoprotein